MVLHGDLFDVLPTIEADSIDACVTDPPYGLGFMGKQWDTFKPGVAEGRITENRAKDSGNPNLKGRTRGPASSPSAVEYDRSLEGQREFQSWTEAWAREVRRVLKPGAYLVVCGAPRSYHRMASGLEDAGFEIRDCFCWLFGQGFPKSLNVGDGRGTALKPAYEPIVLARKPFKGTLKENLAKHGTGAVNIDACRIPSGQDHADKCASVVGLASNRNGACYGEWTGERENSHSDLGRWPANVLLDEDAAAMLDEQSASEMHSAGEARDNFCPTGDSSWYTSNDGTPRNGRRFGDNGGASRFFYVAKPSREERDAGIYDLEAKTAAELTGRKPGSAGLQNPRAGIRAGSMDRDVLARVARNHHPTVKPVELMRWLVKLVTPPNGKVLDPFAGSGTTGMACAFELREFIGIEREAEYVEIAKRRIAACAPLFTEVAQQ